MAKYSNHDSDSDEHIHEEDFRGILKPYCFEPQVSSHDYSALSETTSQSSKDETTATIIDW